MPILAGMSELLVLRLIHFLGGIFWVGSVAFTTFFLLPVLKDSGPAAAHVMIGLQKRRFLVILPVTALLTILSGIRLMMITSSGFSRDYFQMPSGRAFAVSGTVAIVAFLIGIVVARPGAAKMTKLSQIAVSDEINRDRIKAEIAALQKRVAMSSTIVVILLVLAAAGMAVARYL